ncbi:MAG TPA: patatin-like phospholipase family protein [Gammaproteobacteria bacterium]|nr:patatin-like phospholipase family protein [Gammaproteobacteria bacterium]
MRGDLSRGGTPLRLLTLDGGGIRGLITAVWLHRLLEILGRPLAAGFDVVAGTSTGSILAAALGTGRSTDDVIAHYQRHGRDVFPRGPGRLLGRLRRVFTEGLPPARYDSSGLQRVLQEVFGDARLGEVIRRTLITCYEPARRRPVVLDSDDGACRDLRLRDACMASSALPGLFPPYALELAAGSTLELVDGGEFDYNPLAQALLVLLVANPECCRDGLVVGSLGTGISRDAPAGERAAEAPSGEGDLRWLEPALARLSGGPLAPAVRDCLRRARYHRLQVELEPDLADPDGVDSDTMRRLLQVAQAWIDDGGRERLSRLAGDLLSAAPVTDG